MHKGHLLRFFSFVLFFISFCFFTTPTYAATDTPFSNFALTAGKSTSLGIPEGQDDLFYHNNIMFYAWCPNGSDGGSTACESVTGSQVTWIGDSYSSFFLGGGQYTYDYIEEKLPGVDFGPTKGDSTSYVQGSKFANSGDASNPSGISILEKIVNENKLRDYLVFALGTNGGGLKSSEVDKVLELAKNKHVIFVTARTRDRGENVYNNDAVRKAAEENENVTVVDWVQKVGNEVSKYYGSDEIHPTPDGLKAWVDLIIESLPSNCSDIIVSGSNTEEKAWTGLRRLGFTPTQAAGIIGNISTEGKFNPMQWEVGHEYDWGKKLSDLATSNPNKTGMGIVGFTDPGHYSNLNALMDSKASDIKEYLESKDKVTRYSTPEEDHRFGNYYLCSGECALFKIKEDNPSQGELIFDRLLSIQLIYISDSVKNSSGFDYPTKSLIDNYGEYLTKTTIEDATYYWMHDYERPGDENYQDRLNEARRIYDQFKDLEVSPLSGALNSQSSNPSVSSSNSSGNSSSSSVGNNKDYAGNQALSDDLMSQLEINKQFYQKAAEKYGIEWQVIAAIHYREHSLGRDNPNGHGPYQMPGIMQYCIDNHGASFSANTETDDNEFQKHTDCVAHYAADYGVTDSDSIKRFFYAYNSGGGATSDKTHSYYQQAINLGFSEQEALNGEGSPYVMNMYDEKRDPRVEPTKSNNTWGQIFKDHGSIEYPASIYQYGAFVIYQALGGSTSNTSSTVDECGNGEESTKCENNGVKIAKMATEMAWSVEEGKTHQTTPTDKQKSVQDKLLGAGADYTDCGKFAAAAVIESGADPDFPKGVTGTILAYLQKSDKWQEINDWNGDESKLQDGDFLVKDSGSGSGHAMIYTGKTSESKGGTWADASLGGHVGIVRNYEGTSYTSTFHVFRLKGDNNCDLSDGLTDEQAQKLADYYNSSEVKVKGFDNKNNCVGFSAFFVSWLTDLSNPDENPTSGDGFAVAGNLISKFNLPQSEGPKAFSVFSTTPGSFHSDNHTGVVVRVNDDGTVTTIESACNKSCDGGDGWGRGFSSGAGNAVVWTNQTLPSLTYAYFSDHMNSKLNEIINR